MMNAEFLTDLLLHKGNHKGWNGYLKNHKTWEWKEFKRRHWVTLTCRWRSLYSDTRYTE